MRRAAFSLKVSLATVQRRLRYLAKVSDHYHAKMLRKMDPIKKIVFDDMESYIHTKLKPASIPMAVENQTRIILSFDVVSMPAKGPLAKMSVAKYGKRKDDRKKGWETVLSAVKRCSVVAPEILSDSHKMYPSQIRGFIPDATHKTVLSRKACVAGQGELKKGGHDPMFSFNHTAAMLRANISRLIRQTWCTTKKIEHLRYHIAIYRLWHNETILARQAKRLPSSPFEGLC
jgi:hypothetical protein